LEALGLVNFNINPHYYDQRNTQHRGETRPKRLSEFHEENDNPVVGLPEGTMLWVEGNTMKLRGEGGAKLFKKGGSFYGDDIVEGADLSFLL